MQDFNLDSCCYIYLLYESITPLFYITLNHGMLSVYTTQALYCNPVHIQLNGPSQKVSHLIPNLEIHLSCRYEYFLLKNALLGTQYAASHNLNECWLTGTFRNKLIEIWIKFQYFFFFQGNASGNVICKSQYVNGVFKTAANRGILPSNLVTCCIMLVPCRVVQSLQFI